MKKFYLFFILTSIGLISCNESKIENNNLSMQMQKAPQVDLEKQYYTYLQNKYIDLILYYELKKQGKEYESDKFSYYEKREMINLLDSTIKEETKEDVLFYEDIEKRLMSEINNHSYVKKFVERFASKEYYDKDDIMINIGKNDTDVISKFQILLCYEKGFDIYEKYLERKNLSGDEEWSLSIPTEIGSDIDSTIQKAVRYTLHSRWGSRIEYMWLSASPSTISGVTSAMMEWEAAANYRISFSEITRCVRWNKFCWVMGWKYFLRIRTVGSGNFSGQSTVGNVPWANMDFKDNESKRTFRHELGHALGLDHEHQRPDRDNYIVYHPNNVQSDLKSQFSKMTCGSYNYYGSTFDFNSIMLYGSTSGGKKQIINQTEHKINDLFGDFLSHYYSGCCYTFATMTKKDGTTFNSPETISETDKSIIRQIYN